MALVASLLLALVAPAAAGAFDPHFHYNNGSYNYDENVPLVRSYSGAFPDDFIPILKEEARNSNAWEAKSRDKGMKDNKAATNWASMANIENPRNAAEMAVAQLFRFAFPEGKLPEGGIAGGEWWVQMRKTTENIGFHIDKDEGTASEEQWMKMPALSTVTYLTDTGGPTMVLKQNTNRGGNRQEPPKPTEAILVFPKVNRHMLFQGDVQHGVVGELGDVDAKERITFLVNWWDKKPIAPYCMDISDTVATTVIRAKALRSGFLGSLFGGDKMGQLWTRLQASMQDGTIGPDAATTTREFPEAAEVPDDAAALHMIDITVPPKKRYNFAIPKADFSHKVVALSWPKDGVGGILRAYDQKHGMSMRGFDKDAGIKLLLFRAGNSDTGQSYGAVAQKGKKANPTPPFDLEVAYPVANEFVDYDTAGRPYVYAVNTQDRTNSKMAKGKFGLKKADFPAVAAQINSRDGQKTFYVMPKPDAGLTGAAIIAWAKELEAAAATGDLAGLSQYVAVGGKKGRKKGKREL